MCGRYVSAALTEHLLTPVSVTGLPAVKRPAIGGWLAARLY